MNMKVINRVTIGTLFAASAALGMTGCGNKSSKYVDNVLENDTLEINAKPEQEGNAKTDFYDSEMVSEPVSRVEDISYEQNEKILKYRETLEHDYPGQFDEAFQTMGTYGATIYYQLYFSPNLAAYAVSRSSENVSKETQPGEYNFLTNTAHDLFTSQVDFYLDKMKEFKYDLLSEGTPTGDQCLSYLNRQMAAVDDIPLKAYEEAQSDIERYKRAHPIRTTQDKAELVRYTVYKLGCLYELQRLEDSELIKDIRVRKNFEKVSKEYEEEFWK